VLHLVQAIRPNWTLAARLPNFVRLDGGILSMSELQESLDIVRQMEVVDSSIVLQVVVKDKFKEDILTSLGTTFYFTLPSLSKS
jgi:hypothetical protein